MAPMRATSGRAVSATILQRLHQALAQGEPLSYQQLADHAGCTVRSVRNYLDQPAQIFGFPIEKSRDPQHRVLVRAILSSHPDHHPDVDPFHDAFLHALFPDDPPLTPGPVVVALPGLPRYGRHQAIVARQWADHSRTRSQALRLRVPDFALHTSLWPLGVVIHQHAGVVLVGLPCDANAPTQPLTIELHRLPDEPDLLEPIDRMPPAWLDDVALDQLIDLPFCATPPGDDEMVEVHVRFDVSLTDRLRQCVWHRSQRMVLRTDGELDVRFGPVPLRLAASWACSFGAGATVLGDKRLRKTVKKRSFSP